MMNKVVMIGNLTKDPEIRTTNGGHSVCTFTLAINRRIADKNGERQADFIPVVCCVPRLIAARNISKKAARSG